MAVLTSATDHMVMAVWITSSSTTYSIVPSELLFIGERLPSLLEIMSHSLIWIVLLQLSVDDIMH